jgi:hypothetical protein
LAEVRSSIKLSAANAATDQPIRARHDNSHIHHIPGPVRTSRGVLSDTDAREWHRNPLTRGVQRSREFGLGQHSASREDDVLRTMPEGHLAQWPEVLVALDHGQEVLARELFDDIRN